MKIIVNAAGEYCSCWFKVHTLHYTAYSLSERPSLTSVVMDWYRINYLILTQILHSILPQNVYLFILFLCTFVSLCGTQRRGTWTMSFRREQACKILITPPSFTPDWSKLTVLQPSSVSSTSPIGSLSFWLPTSSQQGRMQGQQPATQLCPWIWIQSIAQGHFSSTWAAQEHEPWLSSLRTFFYTLPTCYSSADAKGVRDGFTHRKREHTSHFKIIVHLNTLTSYCVRSPLGESTI